MNERNNFFLQMVIRWNTALLTYVEALIITNIMRHDAMCKLFPVDFGKVPLTSTAYRDLITRAIAGEQWEGPEKVFAMPISRGGSQRESPWKIKAYKITYHI
jgi:hypothetical protein